MCEREDSEGEEGETKFQGSRCGADEVWRYEGCAGRHPRPPLPSLVLAWAPFGLLWFLTGAKLIDQRWITISCQSLAHRCLFLADVDLLLQPSGSHQKVQGPRHVHQALGHWHCTPLCLLRCSDPFIQTIHSHSHAFSTL